MKKLKPRFWRIERAVLSDVHWFIGGGPLYFSHTLGKLAKWGGEWLPSGATNKRWLSFREC